MIIPKPLQKGNQIAIIAPASCSKEKERINAKKSLERLGLTPVFFPSCYEQHGYLAGEDDLRAQDINDAFRDPEIHGIFCLRGGYGSGRLLNKLNYSLIRRHPKIFLGYSDISVIHIALNQICHLMTIHGTMPSINWEQTDDFTMASLKECLFDFPKGPVENPPQEKRTSLVPGNAMGPIIGGNLSLVVSTLGSPYEIDTAGKILFLEDIDEKPYNIDRMLTALSLAGKFQDCAGVLLGSFINCEELAEEPSLPLMKIFQEVIAPYRKPTILNFRCGHTYPQLTFPMGSLATINADTLTVEFIPPSAE